MRRVHRRRGFTLVELLITIVLVGIVFAALVPVFVQAQRTGSGDRARVIAMNVAQSQVELLRDLSYDEVTQAQLPAGTEVAQGKTYGIEYTVEYVYQAAGEDGDWTFTTYPETTKPEDAEAYKLVTVRVSWQGPPTPVKDAVLKTAIYRQVLGSQVTRLTVSPLGTLPSGDTGIVTPTGPVSLTVDISPFDWAKTRSVTFIVQGPDGRTVASGDVSVNQDDPPSPQEPVTWNWTWTSGDRPADGLYTFMATAKDDKGDFGNTWRLWYPVETGPPPAPRNVEAIRGRTAVIVQWERPNASDLTGYEVSRTLPTPVLNWTGIPVWAVVNTSDGTAYGGARIDRTVSTTGSYEYVVRARDLGQLPSDDSTPASVGPPIPDVLADDDPPNPPTGIALSNSTGSGKQAVSLGSAVAIAWSGSTSDDVSYYAVYRDDDRDSPLAVVPCSGRGGSFSVTDRKAGWGSTHSYTVRAMDAALNESGDVSASIAIPPAPIGEKFDITIELSGAYGAQVTVESLADYLSYPYSDSGNSQNLHYVAYLARNGKRTWKDLPYGMYRIRIVFDGPTGESLDARSVIEDIELFQATTRTYDAPN